VSLSPSEIELWHMLERLIPPGDSLLSFVPLLSPEFMKANHARPLADLLARTEKEPVRAVVSMPPRHSKTETILHGIVWLLMRNPKWKIMYVGYNVEFAESKSRRIRELAQRAGIRIRTDARRLGEWITEAGGGVLATGIGGALTGHGCNVLIVDDYTKNREEAESRLIRDRNWEWLLSTALTRIEPGGSAIVNGTRWHQDDLHGRLITQEGVKWEYVNLPALDDVGQALWKERWPAEVLDQIRLQLTEYEFHALYQGQPRPKGGRLFREPVRYQFPDVEGARFVISVDPAATEKSSADYSVAMVACAKGIGTEQTMDIIEVQRTQVEIPKLVAQLVALQKKWKCPVAVEAVGGFKAVPQMLRAIDPAIRILPVELNGDKFTRALAVAAAWNNGRVRLPQSAPWVNEYLQEITSFTGVKDRHDDQVDATSHAFNTISRMAPTIPRGAYPLALPFG
jgi:predicted phage terminase large subunit-like protein